MQIQYTIVSCQKKFQTIISQRSREKSVDILRWKIGFLAILQNDDFSIFLFVFCSNSKFFLLIITTNLVYCHKKFQYQCYTTMSKSSKKFQAKRFTHFCVWQFFGYFWYISCFFQIFIDCSDKYVENIAQKSSKPQLWIKHEKCDLQFFTKFFKFQKNFRKKINYVT